MKLVLPVITLICLFSCQQKSRTLIVMKGSESMHETFEALKRDFESLQDSIAISLNGGGSRTGLMAIKSGQADIGLSSYQFDIDSILGSGHGVTEHVVAYDGIVLVNNKKNPVNELTDEQIAGIYSGRYTDWSQLGGQPGKILPVIRDENSGTQKFFAEHFNVENITPNAVTAEENHEIVSRVFEDEHGIGFIGYAYVTLNVKDISIPAVNDEDTFFVYPSQRSIQDGAYPLKRALMMYYDNVPNEAVRSFLNYLSSSRGQQVLEKNGLISLPSRELASE